MERFNCILSDRQYIENLKKNQKAELDRKFCVHNLQHFLDVARIAYCINLEENLGFSKEIIYTTAILHDIGRWVQYEKGIPHEVSSWDISKEILKNYKYTKEETILIREGILGHRNEESKNFAKLMYRSDKLSRLCIDCKAIDKCKWSKEQKNFQIYF